jgi:hypothetical protein
MKVRTPLHKVKITKIKSTMTLKFLFHFMMIAVTITSASAAATTIDDNDSFLWNSLDDNNYSLEWSIKQSSSNPQTQQRNLIRQKKKDHADDFHWPASSSSDDRHRLVINCKKTQSQDECLSEILNRYNRLGRNGNPPNNIKVIHNLESIHAITVEVDSQTRDELFTDNFELHRDFERKPLVLEGSMGFYHHDNRNLVDGSFPQQYPWGLDAIHTRQVWEEFGIRGEGVKVCVLDTGVQETHEDFLQSKLDGYDGVDAVADWYNDLRGHGTHIVGTIAASDNDVGIVGIVPNAEVFVVKVFDDQKKFYEFSDGTIYSTDLIAAAQICKKAGANIISASLGGESYNQYEEAFFRDLYYESGILTIAAAGNGGNDRNLYPAGYDGVLSVGASDRSGKLARFSTFNSHTTDILAPGKIVIAFVP